MVQVLKRKKYKGCEVKSFYKDLCIKYNICMKIVNVNKFDYV